MAGAAPRASALPDWIREASASLSAEEYLDCAIAVALELVECLTAATGATRDDRSNPNADDSEGDGREGDSSASSSLLRLEDAVPENVMVYGAGNATRYRDRFVATKVTVQPTSFARGESATKISSRDACYASGRIFFELFSRGVPLLLIANGAGIADSKEETEKSLADLLLGDDASSEIGADSPANKKSQPASRDRSRPTLAKARLLLQEQEQLPRSVCRLVLDLLEAGVGDQYVSDTALVSLEEARSDLVRMRSHPLRFLHDQTCPARALDNTALFKQSGCGELYGREGEVESLTSVAARIMPRSPPVHNATSASGEGVHGHFLREAAFLSGHSGSGKSSIMRQVLSSCRDDGWSTLTCKFDHQVAPLSSLLRSFDDYFAQFIPGHAGGVEARREPSAQAAFDRLTRSIVEAIDAQSFGQLCVLLPSFRILFPMSANFVRQSDARDGACDLIDIANERDASDNEELPSEAIMGSGRNRLNYLMHIVFGAVCGCGRPVLFCLDDMQWSDAAAVDMIHDFIQTLSAEGEPLRGGLFYLGSYRENEVGEDSFLMSQIRRMEQPGGSICVTRIPVNELTEQNVAEMISFKFCLPMRHVRELAQLVYAKTRGNPMYVIEFLRSIVQRGLVTYSVRDRRWVWDDTPIEMEMISDGVVELLTNNLQSLPRDVIELLKVISCLGFQVNLSVIQLLDLGQITPNILQILELAVKEGILEKAGPIYAFSHDMLQESTFSLIAVDKRKQMHAKIGRNLAKAHQVADNSEICMLACDQMNICKDMDGLLDPVARELFARLNLAAGKHSIAASSFEKAGDYFEAGISLLHADPWKNQYSLCLELNEMSVTASFMNGKVETVLSRLDLVLSNVRSFDDSLKLRTLRAIFLTSQQQHARATEELLDILSKLGENLPKDACLLDVPSKIKEMHPMLDGITKEKIDNLPAMRDAKILKVMKFMGLLTPLAYYSNPMLMHLLTFRMIQLTFEFGFCDESISGLAFLSNALPDLLDDIQLACRICNISEYLISKSINEQSLRARLTLVMVNAKFHAQPLQSHSDYILGSYRSAENVGDVDNAMLCGAFYCIARMFSTSDLTGLQRDLIKLLHRTAKNKQMHVHHSVMSYFGSITTLIGNEDSCIIDSEICIKTDGELCVIAQQTYDSLLLLHVVLNQMFTCCYFRKYRHVVGWAEKHEYKSKSKRFFEIYFCFFRGIAAICLARDTEERKWRRIGEEAIQAMAELVQNNRWNFENKLELLKALHHNLNGCRTMAYLSYQAAIALAREHKFLHEDALACELFGIFLIENSEFSRGIEQLQLAVDKYRQWGATKKAKDVKDFMESVTITEITKLNTQNLVNC